MNEKDRSCVICGDKTADRYCENCVVLFVKGYEEEAIAQVFFERGRKYGLGQAVATLEEWRPKHG